MCHQVHVPKGFQVSFFFFSFLSSFHIYGRCCQLLVSLSLINLDLLKRRKFVWFYFFIIWVTVLPISSVQFSHSVVSDSLQPRELQHARPPCPSPTPGVHSDSVYRVGDAIQPSHPLSSPSPPAPNPSQHQSLFQWINSSHGVAKVLEFQL